MAETSRQDVIDTVEHINDDHAEEIRSIALVYVDEQAEQARLLDIHDRGLEIEVESRGELQRHSVPFSFSGEPEDKVLFLAYQAMVKLRKLPQGTRTRYLEFVERQTVSPNMLRLIFRSESPLPEDAVHAFLFSLRSLKPNKRRKVREPTEMGFGMRVGFQAMLWAMKVLRPGTRKKLLESMYNGSRYYSLRKATASAGGDSWLAWVDVFHHGSSPGGNWATGLSSGDLVKTTAEHQEKTEHLGAGRMLLIADETGMPTMAELLERWENSTPPVLIVLTKEESEQSYIDEELLPVGSEIHRIVGGRGDAETTLLALLGQLPAIDGAWGGLEQTQAKLTRKYLREHHRLGLGENRIRGYWQAKED
ncbi:MAG: SIP domain-containing protein [Acidobacteriota bacterium]